VAQHLKSTGVNNLVIANRTLSHAEALAEELDAQAVDLRAVPLILEDTDILISSTGSELPILGKGTVERVLKSRRHKPIFMVDLAVPRDIEPEVADLNDVYLYSIDDLQDIIVENLGLRQSAADDALRIIEHAVQQYAEDYNSQDAVDTLRRFRARHEAIKQAELTKAQARLMNGDDPEAVLTALANQLTNKIIHIPSIEIKKSGSQKETLLVIERLFQLDDDT